ncbi:hypothetical protein NDU88_004192 [Pleurodeles waltl]|uniref:Uncharacterized protein n=1 Tax=Pleurodeles waltl TaxID=8319 RepID=A0AAV7KZ70_PLEWA|nr:hypothetical protein NDU88_004192 [Pleurodeles waltl]
MSQELRPRVQRRRSALALGRISEQERQAGLARRGVAPHLLMPAGAGLYVHRPQCGVRRWWLRPGSPARWEGARLTPCCAPRLGVAVACQEEAFQQKGLAENEQQTYRLAPGPQLPPKTPQA